MEIENGVPPATNRGAQNTYRPDLKPLVDWVTVTFVGAQDPRKIIEVFGLSDVDFRETTGQNGYASALRYGHISFNYAGRADMGVNVDISGQGCRELEQLKSVSWQELFKKIFMNGGKFTRLDLALDDIATKDRDLYFKVSTLERKLKRGLCKSKMKRARHIEEIDIGNGEVGGQTLYFGQPSSRIQVRFYEKNYERIAAGYEIKEDIIGWNRTELQLRKQRADKTAGLIASGEMELGKIIAGLLKHYISFISEKQTDTNKSRQKVAKFWDKFLGDIEPLKIAEKAPDQTIERKMSWLDHSVQKSFAAVFYANGSDLDKVGEFINEGLQKLDDNDLLMIEDYINQRKKEKDFLEKMAKKNRPSGQEGQ